MNKNPEVELFNSNRTDADVADVAPTTIVPVADSKIGVNVSPMVVDDVNLTIVF